MKNYTSINDIDNVDAMVSKALALKQSPLQHQALGQGKTIVLLFFNASLRTRLSTEKAAKNLGMEVMVLNINQAWSLEFEDGKTMSLDTTEHVKEAAQVISQYADIIAIRAFPELKNKRRDESEFVISSFLKYATVPIVSMESATAHPLQALADVITLQELSKSKRPKVVLSWAPHPKALPHAVSNSFVKMMQRCDIEFSIVQPKGYELDPRITQEAPLYYNQEEAFAHADFVYVKNWSSYQQYGQVLSENAHWMITPEKLQGAKFMHCLPVRRNVVVSDAVLDGPDSVVIQQAANRVYAAQAVLQTLLENREK